MPRPPVSAFDFVNIRGPALDAFPSHGGSAKDYLHIGFQLPYIIKSDMIEKGFMKKAFCFTEKAMPGKAV